MTISTLRRALLGSFCLALIACGSSGGSSSTPGTAGTTGAAGTGTAGTTGGGGTTGAGGSGVPTPMGTLFMDDFESGGAKWDVTQGTCSLMADDTAVFNCINGGNEARAVAGDAGWGEYTVQARVKLNAMDPTRRIYLAGRFTDSNNWYGATIYNGTPMEVQIRKKVAGASSDVVRMSYPFTIGTGTWYTLKMEMKGSTLRVSVDGVVQLEATDTSFAAGKIALLDDRSDISWDDVIVTNP